MSTIAVNAITNAAGGNTATINGYTPTASNMAGRNRIINGDFRIWQRGTSFTPNSVIYGADRFASYKAGALAGDYARSTDVPTGEGFTYSGYFNGADIRYAVELLGAGLPGEFVDGSQWTLSFWVKAGASGTATTNIGWANGVSASSLTYWGAGQTYSYSTSWQKITLAFTVSGAPTGAHLAALIYFSAVSGLYITGVQLEAGSVATPFERRDYGRELMMCQRYYWQNVGSNFFLNGYNSTSNLVYADIPNPVTMRANPTVALSAFNNLNASNAAVNNGSTQRIRVETNIASTGFGYSTFNITVSAEL